jgi:hypothetical protein
MIIEARHPSAGTYKRQIVPQIQQVAVEARLIRRHSEKNRKIDQ